MKTKSSRSNIIYGVRDWILILTVVAGTAWGFTLPDLPVDPAIRKYLNEKVEKREARERLIEQKSPSTNSGNVVSAIRSGNLDEAKSLLSQKKDVNEEDSDGNTPLIWAVRNNNVSAVKLLLSQPGINIGCQNKEGTSAYAYAFDNEEIATLLKEKGAVR